MAANQADGRSNQDAGRVAEQVAEALRTGAFDPQHAGEVFLRQDAEKALRAALGGVSIAVAGRDGSPVRPVGFMGQRFQPDLVVDAGSGRQVAVTLTLLRGDASPLTQALAGSLVLAGRYAAVVALVLDRRLARRNPFDDPSDRPEQRDLSDAEQALIQQLWERQRIKIEVRRQDPFGW
jgi:hypothetical protein